MILKNGKRIDGCTDTLPIGTVQPFLGLTPPKGYLLCQGQKVSKTVYSELYAICGDLFGQSTETEFYLPDLRGKTIAGYNENDNTMNSIGKLLGSTTHIHDVKDHYHILPYFDGNGGFAIMDTSSYNKNTTYPITQPSEGNWYFAKTSNLGDPSLANGQHGTSTATDVQTEATSNFQPTIVMNWIVKAVMLIPEYFTVVNSLDNDSYTDALSAFQGKVLNSKFANYLPLTGGNISGAINPVSHDTWSLGEDQQRWGDIYGVRGHFTDIAVPYTKGLYDGSTPYCGGLATPETFTDMSNYRTYIGTIHTDGVWYNMLSIRHRNGFGDGVGFGMMMYSTLTNTGDLKWNKQKNSTTWQGERTILDSSNYTSYSPVVHTGSGAPSSSLGKVGDIYIRTS